MNEMMTDSADGTTYCFKIKGYPVWWTVKSSFLQIVEHPELEDHKQLIFKYNIKKYWHCTTGPAIWVDTSEMREQFYGYRYEEYWIDGVRLSDRDAEVRAYTLGNKGYLYYSYIKNNENLFKYKKKNNTDICIEGSPRIFIQYHTIEKGSSGA